jgi:hypothetical protein
MYPTIDTNTNFVLFMFAKRTAYPASCTPKILADKKTSAKNPRYLRSATTRPKDYRNSRQVRDASKFLL